MLEDMQIQNIEFTVFPNPAKEVLGINCDVEKAILKIFDINGRLVLTDLVFSNSEINISELVTGTYIIILSAENGSGLVRSNPAAPSSGADPPSRCSWRRCC